MLLLNEDRGRKAMRAFWLMHSRNVKLETQVLCVQGKREGRADAESCIFAH